MTRIGMNPARNRVSDYRPASVTVVVIVYIPYLSGYFQYRLDVLKLCLGSILKHTEKPYDLFVFDNGSCPEVKSYLRELLETDCIQYLFTASKNVGKIGAFKIIFEAVPGELIAYTDDDIFFYPGWLKAHLKLFDSFPQVGMVSGCAVRTLFDHGIESNLRLAKEDPQVTLIRGHTIPEQWEYEWAESYGRDPVSHLKRLQGMEDMLIEYQDIKAYAAANHNQFLTPKEVITQFLPSEWSGRLMGQMHELDIRLDAGGYLRLSTVDRTTRHMGNTVSSTMVEEAAKLGISVDGIKASPLGEPGKNFGARFLAIKPIKRFLLALYNRLFWILNQQSGGWLKIDRTRRK
jgi:glycosyltransferase involved in cell wall biosynthesis